MNVPSEFDEIRPYNPEELPGVFEELINDEDFRKVISQVFPAMPFEAFAARLRACRTNQEVQEAFAYGLLGDIEKKCTKGVSMDTDGLSPEKRYTFVSNHRDIVLDSAYLSRELVRHHFPCTVEIAIGDNLLIYPWIRRVVRVNKSFIVQRSLQMREMLMSSARMSRYMHYAINVKKENIWIAQREGRAKDSNDRTQDSILKMMAMGGKGDVIESLTDLHIVPLSISYEYDPCDFLKAKEFQQKRDNPDYVKTREDDLRNMQTGIFGYKGHVHYKPAPCLDEWLAKLDSRIHRNEIFDIIAKHIDREIYKGYCLYPGNYAAADLLLGDKRFADKYSEQELQNFEKYIASRIEMVDLPDKDTAFLRERLLTMYANPVINKERALAEE